MNYAGYHAEEREELGRIDYFLDQLARAVERGEVPLSSYETLAPRYLERRTVLVSVLTGPTGPPAPTATAASRQAPPARRKAPPKPVDWTTVLLFLGAFLVIAASAIFAITVWDIAGPFSKLVFMGALTIGFYAAGYFARTRLHLRAGSVALTVVASAMLLFDSWIVISGFSLAGPLPWAVALLVISAVYWFTEVRLGDRFYGIAGAAAQVGWWWLMGSGLHLEVPVRLAGIAVVALVWQLLAERARADTSVGSLARVLLWAAPIVELLAAFGIAFDALTIGSPTGTLVGAALAAAASGAVVAWRTELIGSGREWVAGAAQVPFFIVLFLPGEASWPGVAFLATVTAAYVIFALLRGGAPFTVAALITESLAVASIVSLVHASDRAWGVVFAALAVTWAAASRLAETDRLESVGARLRGIRGFALTAWIGSFILLVAVSAWSLFVGMEVPLTGARMAAGDVAAYAAVLACWAAASLARRGPIFALSATAWSFVSLAAFAGWVMPAAHSTSYALSFVALAGVWLAARVPMERFYRIEREWLAWTMRGLVLAIVAVGLLAEGSIHSTIGGWYGAALLFGGALFFAGDAVFAGPVASAAAAGVLAVFSAYLAADTRLGFADQTVVAAAAVAVVLSALGATVRAYRPRHGAWLAVASAGAGTVACATGIPAFPGGWGLPGGLALAAAAWVAAGVASREPRWSAAVGLTAFAAVAAALFAFNAGAWVIVAVLGATGVALGMTTLVPAAAPGGSHRGLGDGFSLAGLLGLIWLVAWSWSGPWVWLATSGAWVSLGEQAVVVSLMILGAYVVVQATWRRFEPGLYAGYGVVLLAVFVQFGDVRGSTAEWYSTALGVYLVAMGYLFASREESRSVPVGVDLAATVIALGVPVQLSLAAGIGAESFTHTAWAVVLSLVFVAAGIVLKVRAYLFGGAAALVLVTGYRTITYLAAFWWLVLGLVGMVLLVIALTWERQRLLLSETQRRLKDSFENWR